MAINYDHMNESFQEFLAHHGVKGQKWGVRKDRGHEGDTASTRKIARLDKKFEKKTQQGTLRNDLLTIKIHDRAAADYNKNSLNQINNKPKYKNQDFLQPSKLRTQYYAEHQAAFAKALDNAAKSLGTNASGTKRYAVGVADDGSWSVTTVDVQHADAQTPDFKVWPKYDAKGYIIGIGMKPTDMKQGEAIIDAFLAHTGDVKL